MGRIAESIVIAILIIIVLTYFINHGEISFTGVDMAANIVKDSVTSDEGQELITEFKDISNDVVSQMATGTIDLIKGNIIKKEKTEGSLISVVDGDTLIVNLNGENIKVRLIGVDTPESVNPDESLNNIYGELASAHTKELLEDIDTLYLSFDDEIEDEYGRCLAYVWLDDIKNDNTDSIKDHMLNAMILRDGYANPLTVEPNTKYTYSFSKISRDARSNNKGLWKEEDFVKLWDKE